MQWNPEETFDKLLRDDTIESFYRRKRGMPDELKQILDDLEAKAILSTRKANQWIYDGDPYGFRAEKGKAIKLIDLIRFLRNDDFEAAIATIDSLSNFDRKIIPEELIEYLDGVRQKDEEQD